MPPLIADGQLLSSQVDRCRSRQREWEQASIRSRLRPIGVFRSLLAAEHERLGEAVQRDIDKPPPETLAAEILPLAAACKFLQRHARGILQPRQVPWWQRPIWLWGQEDAVYRRPRGVIGVIGTWNYPLFLSGVQIMHALAAGNGVIWKPSELATASAEALWDLLIRAGFPEGLLQRLPATREAGRQLAESDIDHVVFTGGTETGRNLAGNLGRRLISSTLELSGNDAMLVLPDGDPIMAARAAWFGMTLNRGQSCVAVRRAFVSRNRYDDFLATLRPLAAAVTDVSLLMPAQADHAEHLIQEALLEGAHLLVEPAETGPSASFRPTVLFDVRPEMLVCRDATFAPVLAVIPYDRVEDALAGIELCPYGLGASIFSGITRRAARLASRIRAGMVTINDVILPMAHPATPFGGRGASGWGVTQGREGLLEMTVPQVVSVQPGTSRPHYELVGSNRWSRQATLEALLQSEHAASWRTRVKGLWRLAHQLLRG